MSCLLGGPFEIDSKGVPSTHRATGPTPYLRRGVQPSEGGAASPPSQGSDAIRRPNHFGFRNIIHTHHALSVSGLTLRRKPGGLWGYWQSIIRKEQKILGIFSMIG